MAKKTYKWLWLWVVIILGMGAMAGRLIYVRLKYTDTEGNIHMPSDYPALYQLKSREVPAVTAYLKNSLNDWDSYEPVSWGPMFERNGNHQVSHQFRAANGFGAKKLVDWIFTIDRKGTVLHAETIQELTSREINVRMQEEIARLKDSIQRVRKR